MKNPFVRWFVWLLIALVFIIVPCILHSQPVQGIPLSMKVSTPAVTYWTYDPSHSSGSGIAFSSGNTVATFNNGSQNISIITNGTSTAIGSRKVHWEVTLTTGGGATNAGLISGLSPGTYVGNLGNDANGFAYFSTSGGWYAQGVITFNSCGTTYWSVTNNVVAYEWDGSTTTLKVYLGTTTSGSGGFVLQCTKVLPAGTYYPAISSIQSNVLVLNTGQTSYYMTPTTGYGNL